MLKAKTLRRRDQEFEGMYQATNLRNETLVCSFDIFHYIN